MRSDYRRAKTRLWYVGIGFVWLFAVLAGCGKSHSPAGLAGLPASGTVRITPTSERVGNVESIWSWSIIGDRNWSSISTSEGHIRLSKSYPLNSRDVVGGTHLYEVTVTVTPGSRGSSGKAAYQIRGSTGAEQSSSLNVGLQGSTLSSVRRIANKDVRPGLPAHVQLMDLGGHSLILDIEQ